MPSFCPCFKTKCDKFDKFNFAIPCNSEFPQFLQKLAINVATFGRDLANMLTEKELHCHLPFSRGYPLTSSRVRAGTSGAQGRPSWTLLYWRRSSRIDARQCCVAAASRGACGCTGEELPTTCRRKFIRNTFRNFPIRKMHFRNETCIFAAKSMFAI